MSAKKFSAAKLLEINQEKAKKKQEKENKAKNNLNKLIAKKRFGQNFLVNSSVKTKVFQSFQKLKNNFPQINNVLEIGPGRGDLTEFLLTESYYCDYDFAAVEIDPESIKFLEIKFDSIFWQELDEKTEKCQLGAKIQKLQLNSDNSDNFKNLANFDEEILDQKTILKSQNLETKSENNLENSNSLKVREKIYLEKNLNYSAERNFVKKNKKETRSDSNWSQNSENQQIQENQQSNQDLQLENTEKDSRLMEIKKNQTFLEPNLEQNKELKTQKKIFKFQNWLRFGDALEMSENSNLPFLDFVLFASLPYNVGSRILVEMCLNYPNCPFCVIIQKEVASKILLTSNLTFFGAFLSLFYDFEKIFDILGGSFQPVPKVTSSLLVAKPKYQNNPLKTEKITEPKILNSNQQFLTTFQAEKDNLSSNSKSNSHDSNKDLQNNLILPNAKNRQEICQILKKLFGMPSKTLANNLKSLGWEKTKIDYFVALNNYQNVRLTWQNYEQIVWQVWSNQ